MRLLLILLVLLSASAAQALDEAAGAQTVNIESLSVRPVHYAPAVLMPNEQVPDAPAPLDDGQRRAWLESVVAAAPGAEQERAAGTVDFETMILTAAGPYLAGQAYLVLTRPQSVHPESTVRFEDDPAAMTAVKVNVVEGRSYLVDFSVRARGPGVYHVDADSAARKFDDAHGALQHVLIALRADASGWTTVRLRREGGGYHLYSVRVTAADPEQGRGQP